jgi:histidine triad (HIT) family protein
MDSNCIFCKIIEGTIPAVKVYEDMHTYAFLDIKPVNLGHTLVIPKKHMANLYELEDGYRESMINTAQKIARAIKSELKADGVNLGMNNDEAAGQIIFHAHLHVIPRFKDDGLVHWGHTEVTKEQLEETGKKLSASL